jgi:Family of unknown function (DUF6152)
MVDDMKYAQWFCGLVATTIMSDAIAHHSTAGYDVTKIQTLSGTVTKFYWTNPHMFIYLLVPDEKNPGATIEWIMEAGSPSLNIRMGWKITDVKVGDKITIEYHPSHDGHPDGFSRIVWLANGEKRLCPGYNASILDPAKGGQPTPEGAPAGAASPVGSPSGT